MKTDKTYYLIPDLQAEISEGLRAAKETGQIKSHAIYADSVTKVLLFPFPAGQSLREHVTPHQAMMHVLSGEGEITLGEESQNVKAGAWVMMKPGLPHSIHAKSEMVLLLQVFLSEKG